MTAMLAGLLALSGGRFGIAMARTARFQRAH